MSQSKLSPQDALNLLREKLALGGAVLRNNLSEATCSGVIGRGGGLPRLQSKVSGGQVATVDK